ncbi:MAG: AtpZ/AtpI family protein [Gallionellaceae bacterium]
MPENHHVEPDGHGRVAAHDDEMRHAPTLSPTLSPVAGEGANESLRELHDQAGADETAFIRQVGAKETRKLQAQRRVMRTVWFGLGMMGLVGWSVAVPTLLGAALGIWLDKRYPGIHSWTLTLLIIGLVIGCLNAWHWVAKEDREIRREQEGPKNGGD